MLKVIRILPVATALVGVGVVALATQVRAGGDKVVFPEGFDKGVLYTTVDRADNKQYREFYTSPAAVDGRQEGRAAAGRHRDHADAVQGQARRGRQPREGRQRPLHQDATSLATP